MLLSRVVAQAAPEVGGECPLPMGAIATDPEGDGASPYEEPSVGSLGCLGERSPPQ
jgi:hypothetical protein